MIPLRSAASHLSISYMCLLKTNISTTNVLLHLSSPYFPLGSFLPFHITSSTQ